MAKGAGAAGGGMLASPMFQMLLGAAGTPSGGNAGAGALAGLANSANYNSSAATTQLMQQEAADRAALNEEIAGILSPEQRKALEPGQEYAQPAPTLPPPAAPAAPPPPTPPPQVIAPPPAIPAAPAQTTPLPQPRPVSAMPLSSQGAPPAPPPTLGSGKSMAPTAPGPVGFAGTAPQAPPPAPMGMLPGMNPATMGKVYKAMMGYSHSRPEGLKGMLSLNTPGQKPTGLMQNLEAAGLDPGTDPYKEAMMKAVTKPLVGMMQSKPPAGYAWDPDGNLTAIEGGPATKPSDAAVKQQVQSEIGLRLLDEVDALVEAGAETGTGAWAKANAAASPMLSWAVELSADEAKVASNLEMLSNIMLAAQRGAQVGPEEQKRYDKQLPRLGQEKSLFSANLTQTKRNLKEMTARMAEVRKQQGGRSAPPPPPGFVIVP